MIMLDPQVLTFMYFLHTEDRGDDSLSIQTFTNKWIDNHYEIDMVCYTQSQEDLDG